MVSENFHFRRLLVGLSIFLLFVCFSQVAYAFSYSDFFKGGPVSKEKINQAKSHIEHKRRETKNIIQQLKVRENKEINKLSKSQTNLELTKQELVESQETLSSTKKKLDTLESNLSDATDAFRSSESKAAARIRQIYKGERLGFIQLVFAAENINTLMDRIYYQKILTEKDAKSLKELKETANKLAEYTDQVALQKSNILYTISRINQKKRNIAQDINTSQYMITKLRTDRATYEQAEVELSHQSDKLASMLMRGIKKSTNFKTVTNFLRPTNGYVSSPFGWRRHPLFGSRSFHSGVDLAAPNMTAIKASNTGVVIYTGWYGGYGKVVIINHGNYKGTPTTTLYAHLSRTIVSKGQKVEKGRTVGYEGTTGYSTGPHLHFEVRLNGKPTNPLGYIN
jgi:murein DD-endopeptidase MepM/ murein hydrolase activator NlpD